MRSPWLPALVLLACGDSSADGTAGAGSTSSATTTSGSTSSSSTGSTGTGGAAECPEMIDPRPDEVPETWIPWTCWSPYRRCVFWIAPSLEEMPEPVAWEPCVDAPLEDGVDCERMTMPWDGGGGPSPLSESFVRTLQDGTPALVFTRLGRSSESSDVPYDDLIVAEPDGAVRYAIRQVRGDAGCFIARYQGPRSVSSAPATATNTAAAAATPICMPSPVSESNIRVHPLRVGPALRHPAARPQCASVARPAPRARSLRGAVPAAKLREADA